MWPYIFALAFGALGVLMATNHLASPTPPPVPTSDVLVYLQERMYVQKQGKAPRWAMGFSDYDRDGNSITAAMQYRHMVVTVQGAERRTPNALVRIRGRRRRVYRGAGARVEGEAQGQGPARVHDEAQAERHAGQLF